jgi:hypothetical protein
VPKLPTVHKSASDPASLEWESKQLRIALYRDGKVGGEVLGHVWVEANCLGPLAVYPATDDPSLVTVGHWPSGTRIVTVTSPDDAFKVVDVLTQDSECLQAFMLLTPREIVAAMPRWVKPWTEKCDKGQTCRDHLPHFKEGV